MRYDFRLSQQLWRKNENLSIPQSKLLLLLPARFEAGLSTKHLVYDVVETYILMSRSNKIMQKIRARIISVDSKRKGVYIGCRFTEPRLSFYYT